MCVVLQMPYIDFVFHNECYLKPSNNYRWTTLELLTTSTSLITCDL